MSCFFCLYESLKLEFHIGAPACSFFLAKVNSLRRVMVSRGEENLPTDIDEVEEAESEWKT